MNMKRFVAVFVVSMLGFITVGCEPSSSSDAQDEAQEKMAKKTGRLQKQAIRQTDIPEIDNFFERKIAKWIYELRDDPNLNTYTYVKSEYQGKFHFLGETIGYGLPYSVQFSNPKRVAHEDYSQGGSFGTLPQPEPNGLYTPDGLDATWVLLDTGGDKPEPIYVESDIMVTQSKLPARLLVEVPEDY